MNFQELAKELLPSLRDLLPKLLPGGKIKGSEYVCASINGGKGKSFSVNIKTGQWAEFAGDLKGGDVISLYAAINGVTQSDAFLALGGKQEQFAFKHYELNLFPEKLWYYKSALGQTVMIVARYKTTDGKTFLPWTMNGKGWVAKSLPAPRPLYGLDLLAERPLAPVLIVEGEKAADAARSLAPDFVVVTWPTGAKSWDKADWTPLFGKPVIVLWPDADKPGQEAMTGIVGKLAHSCRSIKVLDVDSHSEGWDAADALAEGWASEKLYAWIDETPEQPCLVPDSLSMESAEILLSKPEPKLSWLIEGLWTSESKGLIAGNPNVGKTWLSLDMLISVVSGQMCLGKYPVPIPYPGLLIEEEASHLNLSRRLHALARGRGLSHASLRQLYHMTHKFPKLPKHEKEIISLVKNAGIKLVVFDSLRRFHNQNENSSDEMQVVLDAFTRIGLETGASVILIHHLAKQNEKVKKPIFERMRGTGDLWAWRDCLLGLEGQEDSDIATLSFQFRDAENPAGVKVRREVDDLTGAIKMVAVDLIESDEFQEHMVSIKEYLKTHMGSWYKEQIFKNIKGRKSDLIAVFKVAIANKIVVPDGQKWQLNDVPDLVGTCGNVGT